MIFKYLILGWGIIEFILGITVLLKKKLFLLGFIVESFSILNNEFNVSNIKDIKTFSRWIGEVVVLEGSLYIFLASASIFFEMSIVIIIVFIILIEIFFFNVINKGIKNFIK
ncbi:MULTISPECIES: hypothetical protein [Clostridium]|uniref:hypothetical protein n=1 Tax=Clostridium TaxID=1485 RepID=UPI00189C32A5|nr:MULTISPECIES: hypothetical protein [Clostridium]MDI9215196.1 hypothetical protein [Clostridium tertium]